MLSTFLLELRLRRDAATSTEDRIGSVSRRRALQLQGGSSVLNSEAAKALKVLDKSVGGHPVPRADWCSEDCGDVRVFRLQ